MRFLSVCSVISSCLKGQVGFLVLCFIFYKINLSENYIVLFLQSLSAQRQAWFASLVFLFLVDPPVHFLFFKTKC